MKRGFVCILLSLFAFLSVVPLGCTRKNADPKGKEALQWKKDKEKELTGEDADRGD